MAKRPSRKKASSASSGAPSRAKLLRQIERCDRELLKLANTRAKLYQRFGKQRPESDESFYDAASEHESLQQAVATNKGPLEDVCVHAILRELVSGSRALVVSLRVAYLGPPYSYSHMAAIQQFGRSVELVPVSTIAAVFDEVNRRQVDFGLVPIENSTDGRIVDTLDMFARLPVKICGEVPLRIHHHLLAKCPREEVREVYSKPQALSQCREWLSKHLVGVRMVEMTSTAAAAKLAVDKPGAAAVASREAGVTYGLDVLASNIEDNKNNITRFAVIGSESCRRTGNDKTSLMFEIPHKPGALADAMMVFKRNRLNLTWIESFPMSGTKNEYLFFVEFEGHENDLRVKRAMASLAKKTVRLEALGSYRKSEPYE